MALLRTCLGMSTVWMTTTAVSMAMSSPPSPSPQCSPIGPRTCTITAPPGFTATGNGWFRMSPAQNHSHPNGDNRPAPYPPNGHTNISIECCALYCLSDPECKGFHVYQPCTWTGNHSNCYVAYTNDFLPYNPSVPCPAFLRDTGTPPPPPPPSGWQTRCVAPPPPSPPTKCLGGHPLHLDPNGNIETWLPNATAHRDLVTRAMAFLDNVGNDPSNALPIYLTHGQMPIKDYPHNPASLFTQWTDVALRLYAYNGNHSWVDKVEQMLAFHLANGTTPNASDWVWPGVPYASSDAGDVRYRGSAQGNVSGKGDGVGVIEPDKVGGMGLAWLALWKHYGSGDTHRDFYNAAIQGARVLANTVHPTPNRTVSPWPFRVYAQSGRTRGGGEDYSAHVIWNVQLLDAVLAIPNALTPDDADAVRRARSVAWEWMVAFPLANNNWCGYCEDLTLTGLAWIDDQCDYDSINYRLTSRYLMGVPAAGGIMPPNGGAGNGTAVPWQTAVPKMLSWVENALIFWTEPGPGDPAIQYGARCVSEQRADRDRMSCHTTSYASVLVQYAQHLAQAGNGTSPAAIGALTTAARSWAWSSYCLDDTGNIHVTPGEGESDTWFTVTLDTVLNTLVMMAALPDPGTPDNETHIVGVTAVLSNVTYGNHRDDGDGNDADGKVVASDGTATVLVSYDSSDVVSVERIRVASHALQEGMTLRVTRDGVDLPMLTQPVMSRWGDTDSRSSPPLEGWTLDRRYGMLEVARRSPGRIVISTVKTAV
eukprot:m.100751 g.100751  ORF g.100751 m.100751 type:complete len:763 (+) comp10359_c0_seq3:79-2367(+)